MQNFHAHSTLKQQHTFAAITFNSLTLLCKVWVASTASDSPLHNLWLSHGSKWGPKRSESDWTWVRRNWAEPWRYLVWQARLDKIIDNSAELRDDNNKER